VILTAGGGKYIVSLFGPLFENGAFLVDGCVAGGTAVTVASRNFPKQYVHYHRACHDALRARRRSADFPKQFLHYHSAGHGAGTSPHTQRGYTAFVHTKPSRVQGASGVHVGTMSFGKMEGDVSDKNIAFMLQGDVADGPYYHQTWGGMAEATPIISGGMNALRLPAFFPRLASAFEHAGEGVRVEQEPRKAKPVCLRTASSSLSRPATLSSMWRISCVSCWLAAGRKALGQAAEECARTGQEKVAGKPQIRAAAKGGPGGFEPASRRTPRRHSPHLHDVAAGGGVSDRFADIIGNDR